MWAAGSIVGKRQHRLTLAARERRERLRNRATVARRDGCAHAIAGRTGEIRGIGPSKRDAGNIQRCVAGIRDQNALRQTRGTLRERWEIYRPGYDVIAGAVGGGPRPTPVSATLGELPGALSPTAS